jgi:Tfp pilus assembly protein FimT
MNQGSTRSKIFRLSIRQGFALSELLIIVVILGILSGPVILNSRRDYNRDRVNAVATSFAAWLQAIQAAATREVNQADPEDNGCRVIVTPGNNLNDGSTLATVTPTTCSPESTFRINASVGGSDQFTITGPTISNPPLVFNPRGGISATTDQVWTVQLVGSDVRRCVQLTRGFGAIRIGTPGANNTCVAGSI